MNPPDPAAGASTQPIFEAVLDEIDYGIVMCTRSGVRHCNRAALQQLVDARCPLAVEGTRLVARDTGEDTRLHEALQDTLARGSRRLMTLRLQGRPLHLALVPLAGRAAAEPVGGALVLMARRALCPQLTAYWFCEAHRLTPAESAVATALFAGEPPRAIAERNGVALCTVRTQIASIVGKTATRGVRDLLVKAAALPPLLALAGRGAD